MPAEPEKIEVRCGATVSVWQPAHSATGPSSVIILRNQNDTDRLRFNWLRYAFLSLALILGFSLHCSLHGISLAGQPVKFLPSWSQHSRSPPP